MEYRERLNAPLAWWLLAVPSVITLGGLFYEVLSDPWPLVIMAGLAVMCALALVAYGRTEVQITDGTLRAGTAKLPLTSVSEVVPLDERQSALLRGPKADPVAFLYSRPYLKQSVYLAIDDPRVPYWQVGTRRPAELAAAVEKCRTREQHPA
jgi:Protein of unknown function (DUF3093)